MVGVLSGIAVERLETLGMRRLNVPLGVAEDEPHTVILVSNDFETNKEKLAVLVYLIHMWQVNCRSRLQMNLGCGPVV